MEKNYEIFKQDHWWDKRYDGRKKEFRCLPLNRKQFFDAQTKAIHRRYIRTTSDDYAVSRLRQAYLSVKEWAKPEHGSYQKVVMYGHTWMYLCSPIFGHSDYNKSRLIPIEGNQKKCEFLIKVSKRIAEQQP